MEGDALSGRSSERPGESPGSRLFVCLSVFSVCVCASARGTGLLRLGPPPPPPAAAARRRARCCAYFRCRELGRSLLSLRPLRPLLRAEGLCDTSSSDGTLRGRGRGRARRPALRTHAAPRRRDRRRRHFRFSRSGPAASRSHQLVTDTAAERAPEAGAGACLGARRGPDITYGIPFPRRRGRRCAPSPRGRRGLPPGLARLPGPRCPPAPPGGTRCPPGSPRGDTSPPDAASPRRGQSAPPRHRGTPSSCCRGQSTHRTRRAPFRGAGRGGPDARQPRH